MSTILAKRLCLCHADQRSDCPTPSLLHRQIFIDPVLPHEPVALAGVTRKHLPLRVENARHIDAKVDGYRATLAIIPFDRLNKVKIGDLR